MYYSAVTLLYPHVHVHVVGMDGDKLFCDVCDFIWNGPCLLSTNETVLELSKHFASTTVSLTMAGAPISLMAWQLDDLLLHALFFKQPLPLETIGENVSGRLHASVKVFKRILHC